MDFYIVDEEYISYYVAVSSFKTKQEANILIYIPSNYSLANAQGVQDA